MHEVTKYVTYAIGPGAWYHLPGTDVEIFVHSGPMVNLSVRKQVPVKPTLPEPTLIDPGVSEKVVKKNATP